MGMAQILHKTKSNINHKAKFVKILENLQKGNLRNLSV